MGQQTTMKQAADEVLFFLEEHGYKAYKVGGYARDRQLGYPVSDIDIATSATPEEMQALFSRAIPTGIEHGTMTVIWQGHAFEITTFRIDGTYSNHRQPDHVSFVRNIYDDLARRDFTINAMAVDRLGNWLDPFDGKRDLESHLLRAVGDPMVRFEEDPLRVLRGIRFSARLGLEIEPRTWHAMQVAGPLLASISSERIRDEVSKIFTDQDPEHAIQLLRTTGLFPFSDWHVLLPGKENVHVNFRGFNELSATGRWVGLWLQANWTADDCRRFLKRWRFSKRVSDQKLRLYRAVEQLPPSDQEKGKRTLLSYGLDTMLEAVQVKAWVDSDLNDHFYEPALWRQWDEEITIHQLQQLAVNGQDLIHRFERKPGPWVGTLLHTLFEQVALFGLPNEREHLLRKARKVLTEK